MFLNQTTKYALRVLMEMAEDEDKIYSAHFLHEKLDIPQRYLMRLLTDLSKHGFIESTRGRIGGFRFKMKPGDIYLSTVIDTLEGLEKYQTCFFGIENCQKQYTNKCTMHDPWQNIWKNLYEVLTTTTIGDLHEHEPLQLL
jgi:Rrf2 family protein